MSVTTVGNAPHAARTSQPSRRRAKHVAIALIGPALIVIICLLRSPEIMREGRFWAEDTFFYNHAIVSSFLEKLTYVYKGHLEILSSFAAMLASYAKIKMAPLVTTYFGLLIELVLAFLIVCFREDLKFRLLPALLICVLLVISPCASEHYLNTLNSQWLTSAILLLIINLPAKRLEKHPISCVTAASVLGLSGVPAASLAPIALLYALAWRSRPHLLIALALASCCAIQLGLLATHGVSDRFVAVNPLVFLAAPFLQVLVKHLAGVDAENALGTWFLHVIRSEPYSFPTALFAPLAILLIIVRHIVHNRKAESSLLLMSFLYVVLFNMMGAGGDRFGMVGVYAMRYFFLPSFILALLVARSDFAGRMGRMGKMPVGIALLVFVSVVSTRDFFFNRYNEGLVVQSRDWRHDVDNCRAASGPCRIEVNPGDFFVDIPEQLAR